MIKTSNQAKPWTPLFLVPLLLSLMVVTVVLGVQKVLLLRWLRVQIPGIISLMDVYIVVFSFMSENPGEAELLRHNTMTVAKDSHSTALAGHTRQKKNGTLRMRNWQDGTTRKV